MPNHRIRTGEAAKFIRDFHLKCLIFRLANDFYREPVLVMACKFALFHEGNHFPTLLDREMVDDSFGRVT